MLEAFGAGLANLFHPETFLFMLGAIILGLVFGIVPGLSGITYLAILIPFLYGLPPMLALPILMAGHGITNTSSGISAILLNVPGTGSAAATLLDGYPMAQQGKAGRAIANALCASAVGGVFGGLCLIGLIPVVRPLVLLFGPPELFWMVVMGISIVASVSSGSMIKGLAAGAIGLILSLVGGDPFGAVSRFAFGSVYLMDGVRLVPLVLGLFAIPEVINMMMTKSTISKEHLRSTNWSDLWQGTVDVFRHWSLTLRCSIIGVIIGVVPGVGSQVAAWLSYGHAKQTSRHPETFGKGNPEGVIGPEAANNSKEGGDLLPTLAFGIPGSSSMALVLGAFMVVGLQPGATFLKEHADIAFTLAWACILANIIAAAICYPIAPVLARIALVKGDFLGPLIVIIMALGTYASDTNIMDVYTLVPFGLLGFVMKKYGYNRPALLLAFILGEMAERYLFLTLNIAGPSYFFTPASMVLIFVILLGLAYTPVMGYLRRRRAVKWPDVGN